MAISSVKLLLVSVGVLSVAIALKLSVPMVSYLYIHRAPLLWSSLVSWLRPPYLYVIINCIIITIAASSLFHKHEDPDHPRRDHHDEPQAVEMPSKVALVEEEEEVVVEHMVVPQADAVYVVEAETDGEDGKSLLGGGAGFEDKSVVLVNGEAVEDEFAKSRSTWVPPPKRLDSTEKELLEAVVSVFPAAEKPLVSARFGHRKPVRPITPEGARALRVSKPKRHETLENTWKAITEGRPMPLTRHLKKSDTFSDNHHGREGNVSGDSPAAVNKSETFRNRTDYQLPPGVVSSPPSPPPSWKLRKEPSLSQDELNRRVEAFIKKFNEEMRLQRQESLNQYKEMVSRGIN